MKEKSKHWDDEILSLVKQLGFEYRHIGDIDYSTCCPAIHKNSYAISKHNIPSGLFLLHKGKYDVQIELFKRGNYSKKESIVEFLEPFGFFDCESEGNY